MKTTNRLLFLFESFKKNINDSIITIFVISIQNKFLVKSSELHRKIKRNGWEFLRAEGTSHYIYEKDGKTYPVPFHGSKEVGKGLERKIKKEMGLK